ncbi:MAG: hypothetical protein ACRDY7_08175 [Acidimicrobiia bacterium]
MLPRDWVTLDLDPDTAEESVRGVVDGMVHLDPGCAEGRAEVEELLSTMTREAIAARALLCGVRFGVDEQGRPVQALVSVTLRAVDGPTDPDGLFERFDDGTLDGRIATLDSGPALRVRSQTEAGFMSWGVFVPVPGADGVVAVVSLLSPSVHHEEQLDAFFDGLVESFRLTRDEDERQEEAQAR